MIRRHGQLRLIRILTSALVAALGLMALAHGGAGRATAQYIPEIRVQVGWPTAGENLTSGAYRIGRYAPVRVIVDWRQPPGGENGLTTPINAAVRVDTPVTTDKASSTTTTFTITPGQQSEATLYVSSLVAIDTMRVRLYDQRGRVLDEWASGAHGRDAHEGGAIDASSALLLVVGDSTINRAGWIWSPDSDEVHTSTIAPDAFPRNWIGLDAVSVVLLGDSAWPALDAAQRRALLEWVARGGEVVIMAGADRVNFDEMIAPLTGDALTADDYIRVEEAPALVEQLRGRIDAASGERRELLRRIRQQGIDGGWPTLTDDVVADQVIAGAEADAALAEMAPVNRYQRLFTVDSTLIDSGWRARELVSNSAANDDEAATHGPIVTGPFGGGAITVIGLEPASAVRGGGQTAAGFAWWAALEHIGPIHESVVGAPPSLSWANSATSDALVSSAVTSRLLDIASTGLGASPRLLITLAIILGALALLVGPIDRIVFCKLKRLPLTWVSCPLWALAASLIIIIAQSASPLENVLARQAKLIDASDADAPVCDALTIYAITADKSGAFRVGGAQPGEHCAPAPVWDEHDWYMRSGDPNRLPRDSTAMRQSSDRTILVDGQPVLIGGVAWSQKRAIVPRPEIQITLRARRNPAMSNEEEPACLEIMVSPLDGMSSVWVYYRNQWWMQSFAGNYFQKKGEDGQEWITFTGRRNQSWPGPFDIDLMARWTSYSSYEAPSRLIIAAGLRGPLQNEPVLLPDQALVLLEYEDFDETVTLERRERTGWREHTWLPVDAQAPRTTFIRLITTVSDDGRNTRSDQRDPQPDNLDGDSEGEAARP